MSKIRWHREPSEDPGTTRWYAEVHGARMAEAVKTGTHLDNYPWDWQLTGDGYERALQMLPAGSRATPRSGGVMDTLSSVKRRVEELLTPF